MEVVAVRCTHCGAPLEVGAQARFVTCRFCNAQLEVKRTESALFTEEVARIAENTDSMAENLETIKLQNEIERLDREWLAEHPHAAPGRDNRGASSTAGKALGLGFSIVFAVIAFAMAAFASSNGAPALFVIAPIGIGIFGLATGFTRLAKNQAGADRALSEHEQRRSDLVRQLESRNRS